VAIARVLVLGAGFIAGPLVRYFFEQPEIEIKIGDASVSKAEDLVRGHPRGKTLEIDLRDEERLKKEVVQSDLVISLVPYVFHPLVARVCIASHKNMVTTSYVSDAMNKLDPAAREAGVTILNEVGLDPGIDHMEAMRIIHRLREEGGEVLGFISYCGGLPAPEANTNPFGYKFSWSPRGVLLAGTNSARYLKDGVEIFVPSRDLFDHYFPILIKGLPDFEGYPNRDSIPYVDLYGIPETRTMIRGTLRYPGWCETLKKIVDLGLLGQEAVAWSGGTISGFLRTLSAVPESEDIERAVGKRLNLAPGSPIMERLRWLGLFGDEPVPPKKIAPLDVLEVLMSKKLRYEKDERDLVVLRHEFTARVSGRTERIVSTLTAFGIPGGDSAMARTVGLPAAVGGRLILEKKITRTGICAPVCPDIYGPILTELKSHGIDFSEERERIGEA